MSYFHCVRLFYFVVFTIIDVKSKIEYNTMKENIIKATVHVPEVIDKACLLKPDRGPCRAEIPMFYFEPSNRKCSLFLWGGCQGNGNRFDTNRECLHTCLSQPGQSKRKPRWCGLTFDYGFCFGAIKRWYYDPIWKVCKKRMYSGCGGNKNNFYNKEQCDAICNYGTGVMRASTKKTGGSKKVLIINSPNVTERVGWNQSYVTTSSTTRDP